MNEAETRIARTFRPRDWVPLTAAFIRIMSFVDGRADLALACINRDLREEVLHAALVASDGTIKMLLEGSDWQRRTVHAPHIPAEGVRVEPYEEGRFFIWRADLDKGYPTNPATPAAAADRQLYAAGGSEPSQSPQAEHEAAAAPTSNAEVGPQHQPAAPVIADPAPAAGAAPPAVTSASAAVSPPKIIPRTEWLDRYLTEERQNDLTLRHNDITSAAREIHGIMSNDPTVKAYARARNIERHPTMRSLFPPSRPIKKKKKG
jgi:hypothetical protein